MAKAKEITGIDCAANALEWAEKVLRLRFDEVIELRAAALDFSDIEGVHAMRVATRRLRSALRDFLPLLKKRPLRRPGKKLKEIADALGAVRDRDVAIIALELLQSTAEIDQIDLPVKAGIEKIIEERRAKHRTAQTSLIKALDADDLAKFREDFFAALDKALKKKKPARAVSFNDAGRAAVEASLDDLRDLGASLYEPFKIEKLHEMRIAAKRLRYAVELFTVCWGDSITPFAVEIAQMQEFLGEVHDCDVWIENLGGRLADENASAAHRDEYPVAVWLLSKFVKNRTKNYRAALQLWSEWEANDFTNRMRTVIDAR